MHPPAYDCPPDVQIRGAYSPDFAAILTPGALRFVADLQRRFNPRRVELLAARARRDEALKAGQPPDFLPETAHIRNGEWQVAPIPSDLQDRRVEITGPAGDRKMVINALNSGARAFMADFEDANSPTWTNAVQGQINMRDAVRRTISFENPDGRRYALQPAVAVLIVRPRGWHLPEKHVWVDGEPMAGALFDFGLFFFHNAKELLRRGSGPYFYLPKLESRLEARLWNDIFAFAQRALGVPRGSIKATVLIETILAAFEMDEILYELREHMAGLNCGRWDYIFSYIKKLRHRPEAMLPDRAQVTMTVPFMRAYTLLAIRTCHRRGAFAMGGMAAQIPIRSDPEKNAQALASVLADKEREARDGHDGTWVAHPGLVPVAQEAFDRFMPTPNQVHVKREDVRVTAADLLAAPAGSITEQGLRTNVSVGVRYVSAWLQGRGAVPIFNLMEDAATAEISRAQVWQWLHHPRGVLEDGRKVTGELFRAVLAEELQKIRAEVGDAAYAADRYDRAADLLAELTLADELAEFLTLPGYDMLE